MAATTGTAALDFGSAPGTNIATTSITSQASITTSSYAEAFLMGDASTTHNAYEHMIVPIEIRCTQPVAGSGFDIWASSDLRLTGKFNVRWVWT